MLSVTTQLKTNSQITTQKYNHSGPNVVSLKGVFFLYFHYKITSRNDVLITSLTNERCAPFNPMSCRFNGIQQKKQYIIGRMSRGR